MIQIFPSKYRRLAAILLGLVALGPAAAIAQSGETPEKPAPLRLERVATPPRLEDYTGKELPPGGVVVTGFRQNAPGDGDPASLETKVFLSYDDENIYAIFVCYDDPAKVRARLTKREDIPGDEGVEIFLDTFHDKQRAFVFAANPFGVQLDGLYTEGQGYDFSFDTVWYSEGRITDFGFVTRIALPFKSLRFVKAPIQTWGIALARIIPRTNEFVYWPYVTNRVEGFVHQFADLEWTEEISPGRNIQLIPYGVLSNKKLLDFQSPEEGFGFDSTTEGRLGLDAKFVLRDTLALDVTLNPDFSQVESDEPQVVVNQRFEVFFPEKRPFFQENAGTFTTPVNLFFSRRIGDPRVGARLTGKLGRWVVGGLVMDDRAPGERVGEGDPDFEEEAKIGVLRVQREFGERSNVGVFASTYSFGELDNRVVALDSRVQLSENWIAQAQVIETELEDDRFGVDLSGNAYFAQLDRVGRHFTYSGLYRDIDDEFQTNLGFVPRIGVRQTKHLFDYLWRTEDDNATLLNHGPHFDYLRTWDQHGDLQDWYADLWYTAELTGQTKLNLGRTEYFERYFGIDFDYYIDYYSISSEWFQNTASSLVYKDGTSINYFPAAGVAPFLGDYREVYASFSWSPVSRLRVDHTYIYSALKARDGLPVAASSDTAFTSHQWRTKANYQFNLRLSVRAIVDYRSLKATPELVAPETDKAWTGDLLFSYIVNSGTALHLGFTENRQNLELGPGAPRSLERTGSADLTTGRQVFLKVSYLLRF